MLISEQNVELALEIADRGYVLETGRVALAGPAQELLRNERVVKAYFGIED
jgi:branched-chain amino acid transport system ATP-binding protein